MKKIMEKSIKAQRDRIVKEIRDEAIDAIAQDELHRSERAKQERKERQVKFRKEMNEVFKVEVGTGISRLPFMFEDESGSFDLTIPRRMSCGRLEATSICGACGQKRFSHPIYKKDDFKGVLNGTAWGWHDCRPPQPQREEDLSLEQRLMNVIEEIMIRLLDDREGC